MNCVSQKKDKSHPPHTQDTIPNLHQMCWGDWESGTEVS